jgi:hypothetical protein
MLIHIEQPNDWLQDQLSSIVVVQMVFCHTNCSNITFDNSICLLVSLVIMELTIVSLVRSFREADFSLYRKSLCELIPFFFANNKVNYARWLPIHLRDLMLHKEAYPQLAAEFHNGKSDVHKSNREFSARDHFSNTRMGDTFCI